MTMTEGGTGSKEKILTSVIEVQANTSTWKGLIQSRSQVCGAGDDKPMAVDITKPRENIYK